MERLTWKRDLDGYTDVGLRDGVSVGDAICQLADYEDTIPLARAKELAQAEKDGRLVVLPCNVGDTVWTNLAMSGWYFRDKDRPYSAKVVFMGLNNSDEMGRGLFNVAYEKHNYMMQFSFSDIDKIVFLTPEEAEAALKKREETDNEH